MGFSVQPILKNQSGLRFKGAVSGAVSVCVCGRVRGSVIQDMHIGARDLLAAPSCSLGLSCHNLYTQMANRQTFLDITAECENINV